jgi:hypothetical protein
MESPQLIRKTTKKGKITGKIFQELKNSFPFSEEMLELFSLMEISMKLRNALMPTREKHQPRSDQLPKLKCGLKLDQQDLTPSKLVSSRAYKFRLKLSRPKLKLLMTNKSSGKEVKLEAVKPLYLKN